jgi:hypothetical protein
MKISKVIEHGQLRWRVNDPNDPGRKTAAEVFRDEGRGGNVCKKTNGRNKGVWRSLHDNSNKRAGGAHVSASTVGCLGVDIGRSRGLRRTPVVRFPFFLEFSRQLRQWFDRRKNGLDRKRLGPRFGTEEFNLAARVSPGNRSLHRRIDYGSHR